MYYTSGDVQNWEGYKLAGFADYVCPDKMSRLEIISMTKEMNLQVEGCTFWWLHLKSSDMDIREIKNDADALELALNVAHDRMINIYAKVSNIGINGSDVVSTFRCEVSHAMEAEDHSGVRENIQQPVVQENINLQVASPGDKKKMDEDSDLHDSEYSFNSQEEEIIEGNDDDMGPGIGSQEGNEEEEGVECHVNADDETETEYGGSEELQSCSETDEEELSSSKPRYAEFHEEFDMKDPQFQIGMKFSSFKQFREAVRNYEIKNRCVINSGLVIKKDARQCVRRGVLSTYRHLPWSQIRSQCK